MELSFSYDVILLLFFIAIIAGTIDTLAGGGGLLTLPTLLILNIPPLAALATNKVQSSSGTLTASLTLLHKRAVSWRSIRRAFLASATGAAAGTIFVLIINADWLEWLIPVVLVSIAIYFLCYSNTVSGNHNPKISSSAYLYGIVPSIGFYDGTLGPGTGSFFSSVHNGLLGQNIVEATARAKCLNFASNIASVIVFIFSGQILWLVGGVMIIGQIIGASIGSRLILSNGQIIIRPLTVIMCFCMCGYFLWNKLLG